ncbi:hypothetical protein UlMin_033681 [Ulmus minor]
MLYPFSTISNQLGKIPAAHGFDIVSNQCQYFNQLSATHDLMSIFEFCFTLNLEETLKISLLQTLETTSLEKTKYSCYLFVSFQMISNDRLKLLSKIRTPKLREWGKNYLGQILYFLLYPSSGTADIMPRPFPTRVKQVAVAPTYHEIINCRNHPDTIDTMPNLKGLCAFSPSLDGCFVALPASTTKGSLLLYNVMELHSHCEVREYIVQIHSRETDDNAHRSLLVAMALSSSGMYIATTFRRGTYPSTIYSLSLGPSMELPDILVATSSSGSIHGFSMCQRSRRSSSLLGSIMPESVTDALEPTNHDVLHNAAPAGVKCYVVIRKIERVVDSSTSEINGYFQEYNLSVSN